jgi:hypothetical protein
MNVREAAKVANRLSTWYVESETTPGTEYIVHNKRNQVSHRKVWTCNCLNFTEKQFCVGGICKHIQAVQNFRNVQIAKEAANKAILTTSLGVKEVISTLMAGLAGTDGLTLWSLVSFLRGPDTTSSWQLKAKTTAVLRVKLGLKGGLVDTNFVDEPFGIEILRRYREGIPSHHHEFQSELQVALIDEFGVKVVTEHFSQHYGEALLVAFKLGYIK